MRPRRLAPFVLALLAPLHAHGAVAYPPVAPGYELVFPRDEGSHPDYRIEWWYVTGHIDDAASKVKAPRGFQVTFFRVRTGLAADNPSSFAPRQVLFAHAALADPAHGKLRHAQRSARTGFDLAYAREGRLDVKLDDWSIREAGPGRYVTVVHGEDFDFEITLAATQPPLLQGERGFSRKGPDPRAASYYYSLPQLAVSGEVKVGDATRKVSGQAWFDHEWSSDYVDESALGWDWLGVNMTDGGALMAFRMRDRQGGERWAGATMRGPSPALRATSAAGAGEARSLGSAEVKTFGREQVAWTPLESWRSPRTGVTYPVQWRVQVGDRRYRIEPLLLDAELDSRPTTGILYWEGPIRLVDEATGKEAGRGYLELTGYGGKLDL
ncbi:MAG: carotenoid 1,2-hydratase [Gammaproteobacteria bacterium]|nr:carotenoid 1,2-hydratase [Gammaproteobacteria bacterium]